MALEQLCCHPPAFDALSCSFGILFLGREALEPHAAVIPWDMAWEQFYPIINTSEGWRSSTSHCGLSSGKKIRKSLGKPKP